MVTAVNTLTLPHGSRQRLSRLAARWRGRCKLRRPMLTAAPKIGVGPAKPEILQVRKPKSDQMKKHRLDRYARGRTSYSLPGFKPCFRQID